MSRCLEHLVGWGKCFEGFTSLTFNIDTPKKVIWSIFKRSQLFQTTILDIYVSFGGCMRLYGFVFLGSNIYWSCTDSFSHKSWKWKTVAFERQLLLEGPILHFNDYGKKGINFNSYLERWVSFWYRVEYVSSLKINMEPKSHPIDNENHLPNLYFWVPCSFSFQV